MCFSRLLLSQKRKGSVWGCLGHVSAATSLVAQSYTERVLPLLTSPYLFLTCISTVHLPGTSLPKPLRLYQSTPIAWPNMPQFLLLTMTILDFLASITFYILFPCRSPFRAQFGSLKLLNWTSKSPAVTTAAPRSRAGVQPPQTESISISAARRLSQLLLILHYTRLFI